MMEDDYINSAKLDVNKNSYILLILCPILVIRVLYHVQNCSPNSSLNTCCAIGFHALATLQLC